MDKKKNVLLTGRPGVGKTTLIRRLVEKLADHHPIGFYTDEIREKGIRRGFELIDLQGDRLVLAHVDFEKTYLVGKYGVDVERFDLYLQDHDLAGAGSKLVIIDEIGKMECFSRIFLNITNELLSSDKMLIATIASKGSVIIEEIKGRSDIELIEVTTANRNIIPDQLSNEINERL